MTLSRRLGSFSRVASWIIGSVSMFLLIFVAYAHVASWRDARLMMSSPRETHFVSAASFAEQFQSHVDGGASFTVDGDALNVHAPSKSSADFVGAETRLVESRLSLRFRAPSNGSFDILVGLDTPAELTHTISLEMSHFGDQCTLRLVGDAGALGPRDEGDRVLAESPVSICDASSHRIELRFAPDLSRVIASVDDQFVFSPNVRWDENTTVRPTFGVHVTSADSPVDVQISEMRLDPVRVDFFATDVDDDFSGKIVDPFWRVVRGDAALVDSTVATSPHGLIISGHALTAASNVPAYDLISPSTMLGSFRASAEVDVSTLDHATFHLQIENEPGPAWRFAEVGFLSTGDGVLVPFASGHFREDGQSHFNAALEAVNPVGRVRLTFDYDAKTRRARATFAGRPFFDEHLDLPPHAMIHFSMGANIDGHGAVDLVVRSLHIDHTG